MKNIYKKLIFTIFTIITISLSNNSFTMNEREEFNQIKLNYQTNEYNEEILHKHKNDQLNILKKLHAKNAPNQLKNYHTTILSHLNIKIRLNKLAKNKLDEYHENLFKESCEESYLDLVNTNKIEEYYKSAEKKLNKKSKFERFKSRIFIESQLKDDQQCEKNMLDLLKTIKQLPDSVKLIKYQEKNLENLFNKKLEGDNNE